MYEIVEGLFKKVQINRPPSPVKVVNLNSICWDPLKLGTGITA
jgi:hypothetical protein